MPYSITITGDTGASAGTRQVSQKALLASLVEVLSDAGVTEFTFDGNRVSAGSLAEAQQVAGVEEPAEAEPSKPKAKAKKK